MVPFDTLAYTKTLEQSGFSRKLAEAHARSLAKLLTQFIIHKKTIANANNAGELNKLILFDILNYANQLIASDENPALALTHAKMLASYLTETCQT